mmetsp:Transcript_7266/g.10939  ORF Transcript_7266/g.10939 Transcript_7266/m.10939 type:complete len:544 (+) Transcript_7266:141-1772(+)
MRVTKSTRRKNQAPKPTQPPSGSAPTDTSAGNARTAPKAATEKEAILTTRNFRLAKELSELREKHREEIKKNRNLNMQNMDLASRCRTAMGQIELMKKELSMNNTQTKESAANKGDYRVSRYSLDTPESDKRNDNKNRRSLATPKHLPQDNSPMAISVASSVNRLAGRTTESSPLAADTFGTTSSLDMDDDAEPSTSPNPVTPEIDEESPSNESGQKETSDIAFGELHSDDFFHPTYASTLPATPEKENINVDAMNQQFDSFLSISENGEKNDKQSEKVGDVDRIDAFEASFQTEFPTSFAESPSPSKGSPFADDFSDSFFMDPSMDGIDTNRRTPHSSQGSDVCPLGTVPDDEMDAPMDEALTLFPDSAFGSTVEKFETPKRQEDRRAVKKKVLSPIRNVLNGAQGGNPRIGRVDNDQDTPMDEARADGEEHSPALVLKRLQQRKAKHVSPAPRSVTHNSSLSISDEIKKLDAIANGSSSSREKRRSVKQPISYAEPTLNSKLRRGDVFFPKENGEIDAEIDNTLRDRLTNKAIASHTELHA